MQIPLWSIVTLVTELVVSASVYYIIWKGYSTGVFLRTFAFVVLGYEFLFNITYMLTRENNEPVGVFDPFQTGLAIFHGTFSLIMFVSLVAFFFAAAAAYGRGENYFLLHRKVTVTFTIAWAISILSGVTFFISLYLL